MFLLRVLVAVILIALFIPLGRDPERAQPREEISPLAAIGAAGAAMNDVRGFCDRQPDACAVGSRALVAVGERARAGAEALTTFLSDQANGTAATASPAAAVPSAAAEADVAEPPIPAAKRATLTEFLGRLANGNIAKPAEPQQSAGDTLLPADRQVPWRTPNLHPSRG